MALEGGCLMAVRLLFNVYLRFRSVCRPLYLGPPDVTLVTRATYPAVDRAVCELH